MRTVNIIEFICKYKNMKYIARSIQEPRNSEFLTRNNVCITTVHVVFQISLRYLPDAYTLSKVFKIKLSANIYQNYINY